MHIPQRHERGLLAPPFNGATLGGAYTSSKRKQRENDAITQQASFRKHLVVVAESCHSTDLAISKSICPSSFSSCGPKAGARTATSPLTRQIILCVRCRFYSKVRTRPARMTRPNCARR
jgi:hypothetical protein